VTTSLHLFRYAVAPGEQQVCVGLCLDLLRHYFHVFFGKDLVFDWGGLDHWVPILNRISMGNGEEMGTLMCYFHVMKIIRA